MFKIILLLLILVALLCIFIVYNTKKEHFSNENDTFTYLLKVRRKLERLDGIKKYIKLTKHNYIKLKNKYKNYFYILVDSGNLGSKPNSEFYANIIGMKLIPKYYEGSLKNIRYLNENINSFVIKPTNLSDSRGLLIIKNKTDIINNKRFNSNYDILVNYKKQFNQDVNIIIQTNLYYNKRPSEIKVYSFNGITGIILYVVWHNDNKRTRSFYDSKWNHIAGEKYTKPKNINDILFLSNKFTKSIGTFMRIDFLIDDKTNNFYFCETSSYPFCGSPKAFPNEEINKMLYKYWKYCFPFNNNLFNGIDNAIKKSIKWTKKESCQKV
jgi:hypothetical protein